MTSYFAPEVARNFVRRKVGDKPIGLLSHSVKQC